MTEIQTEKETRVTRRGYRVTRLIPWVSAIVATVVVTAGVLEIAGRYFIQSRNSQLPIIFGNANWGGLHAYDPDLLWVMRPNQKEIQCPFPVSTNSCGLRSKEVRPMEGQYRILALGDSRTLGSGIYDSETWPALLEERLNEFVPNYFEVINAGVGGYSAYQGMRFLEKYVHEFKPHLVIAWFGTNDWNPIPPGTRGLVEWDDLTRHSGIEALVREALKGACASIEPSPFGPWKTRMRPGEFTDCYVRMRELSLEVGSDFAVMYLPSTVDVAPVPHITSPVQCLMQGIAGYTGAKFLNPISVFPDKCDSLFVDPTHFTLEGNKVIAEYIFDTLFGEYKRLHALQM